MPSGTFELGRSSCFRFDDWPAVEGDELEFRLVYQGRLPSASKGDSRSEEKHEIRRQFHPQLKALWKAHPFLSDIVERVTPIPEGKTILRVDLIANKYSRCGYRFVPLIGEEFGPQMTLACSLDILFLRADHPPGGIVRGGDLDNRIKVLFDALRMPQRCDEIPQPLGADENPFYCLLEDDRLITDFRVTSDRLLTPTLSSHPASEVHLVIRVKTLVLGKLAYTAFLT